MKSLSQHIEHVKGKPHHIRKRVAFGAAAVGAALIALVWLISSISINAFAVKGSSFADATGQGDVERAESPASGLAGAAASLESARAPARIEIVDATSSARPTKQAEQTTIPF